MFFCQSATINSLQDELRSARQLIEVKDRQIARMELELLRMQDRLSEADATPGGTEESPRQGPVVEPRRGGRNCCNISMQSFYFNSSFCY